jgi:hypothetical protein
LRHHHQRHVLEELGKDIHRETLADEVIDITPQKLHHQHKEADEEGAREKQQKLPGDKYIEFLYSEVHNYHCKDKENISDTQSFLSFFISNQLLLLFLIGSVEEKQHSFILFKHNVDVTQLRQDRDIAETGS